MAAVILAGGEGTRMKSAQPKVLHRLCGRPMIKYVIEAVKKAGIERIILVVGHWAEEARRAVEPGVKLVIQKEPLGTGHALRTAESSLRDFEGIILVLCGDTPLLRAETLRDFVNYHNQNQVSATILTAFLKIPTGYGRIIRNSQGIVERIVEEKDATADERKICEINSGAYCFDKANVFRALRQIKSKNKQKEFYLTDAIEILKNNGESIAAYPVPDELETLGINSRLELAEAEKIMREKINAKWMKKGVTLVDPASTFIGGDVKIGPDTIIYPCCFIEGKTSIGKSCLIGPSVRLIDATLGNRVEIQFAVARKSLIEDEAQIGPFCSLRPETVIKKGAKVGTFVEIKKTVIEEKSKVPHLSYIGDATIGKNVNVGAGTITCNYDGIRKHQTVIKDDAFIGSDTMLVAPVKIGKGAVTGAGSTITQDVPPGGLGLERAEQKNIKGWAKRHFKKEEEK